MFSYPLTANRTWPGTQFIAINSLETSTNRIHNNEGAQEYGFKAGLVPGSTLFTYCSEALSRLLSFNWLGNSYLNIEYIRPVYDGDTVTVIVKTNSTINSEDPVEGSVEIQNSTGDICSSGIFSTVSSDAYRGSRPSLYHIPTPDPLPPMVPVTLASTELLAGVVVHGDRDSIQNYGRSIGLEWRLTDDTAIPLGYLMKMYSLLYDANFLRVGPSIHRGTEVNCCRTISVGQNIDVKGRIDKIFRRNGNGYFVIEISWTIQGEDQPCYWALHSAIYDLKKTS